MELTTFYETRSKVVVVTILLGRPKKTPKNNEFMAHTDPGLKIAVGLIKSSFIQDPCLKVLPWSGI